MGKRDLSRNAVLIATVSMLAVAGGGAALGQATADHPARAKHATQRAGSAQDCINALPKPRNAAEAEVRRKLQRELARHPVKPPPGWTFGGCSGGTATTTAPQVVMLRADWAVVARIGWRTRARIERSRRPGGR